MRLGSVQAAVVLRPGAGMAELNVFTAVGGGCLCKLYLVIKSTGPSMLWGLLGCLMCVFLLADVVQLDGEWRETGRQQQQPGTQINQQ